MCYCQFCHVQRNDNEHYNRGKPPRRYALPIGWCRLAVKVPPLAKARNAFDDWYRGFYKLVHPSHSKSILEQGSLIMGGHKDSQGRVVDKDGHAKKFLLSPTIRYCDYYTKSSS